jgi:plasmid stabilization system protein ParE
LAKLIYSDRALEDLDRVVRFLLDTDLGIALDTFTLIEEAIVVLMRHPLIGRPIEAGMRELLISRGRSGYVALYSFEQLYDAVLVLAIRHQREIGYPDEADI